MVLEKLWEVAYDKVDGVSRVLNSVAHPVTYFYVKKTSE